MEKHVFIDTNVFLSFFHMTSEDLDQLEKLAGLVREHKVVLYLTRQVIDEFERNRDRKIADGLKRLKEAKLNLQFPNMAKDYAEYEQLREIQIKFSESHAGLLKRLKEDARGRRLRADALLDRLFGTATLVPVSDDVIDRAARRVQKGNPPGKNGSLGDAINWEALLEAVPDEAELFFVTADGDYASALEGTDFSPFLAKEWANQKRGKIRFQPKLSEFFADVLPEIQLADEREKELAILQLRMSPNFGSTHSIVGELLAYGDFTVEQASGILQAARENSQVGWIARDDDVAELLRSVLGQHATRLDRQLVAEVLVMLGDVKASAP